MRSPRDNDSLIRAIDRTVPDEPAAEVSTAAEQRIAERLVRSLTPVKPMPSRIVLLGAFLAIFVTVAAVLFAVVGTRGAENMTLAQLAGVLAAILASAGFASYLLSGEMTPGQRRFVRPTVMAAAILLVLLTLTFGLFPSAAGAVQGWHCFLSGFLCSIPAVLLVLLVVRKGAPMAYETVGAVAGLLAGLSGMAAIHVGCSLLSAPHMAAGHLTIPLAGAVVGYLAGLAWPYVLPHAVKSSR